MQWQRDKLHSQLNLAQSIGQPVFSNAFITPNTSEQLLPVTVTWQTDAAGTARGLLVFVGVEIPAFQVDRLNADFLLIWWQLHLIDLLNCGDDLLI